METTQTEKQSERRSFKEAVKSAIKDIGYFLQLFGWVFLIIWVYEGIELGLRKYGDRPDLMWMVVAIVLFGGFGVEWITTHLFTDETLRSSNLEQSKEEQN